ncbi:MAG: hypothetical protein IKP97_04235 [Kiritimatiellae bacterium]|jgi:hypothetical protein|nr:hypothetical protein [Kiritimatiellia bacterium]
MANGRELVLVVAVMGLVLAAAALCTPKGRTPLALRGIQKILRRDSGGKSENKGEPVPAWRKWLAFLMVVAAFLLAFA